MNQGKKKDETRDASVILNHIAGLNNEHLRFMEVCGTHTVSISRSGIRSILPREIELISGPGCPVCVTPVGEIDRAVSLARLPNVILVTFGDLMRVPGTFSSLNRERAMGRDVRIITSPLDPLKIAIEEPDQKVIFFAVGFETTAGAIAAAVKEAKRRDIRNLYILSSQRLIPPAIRALLSSDNVKIDGFILPGHVSVIIGRTPYTFITDEFSLMGVITGFEAVDILEGIHMLMQQKATGRLEIENQYTRVVKDQGNRPAQAVMEEIFKPFDAQWRGLGVIPESGLTLREELRELDAAFVFNIPYEEKPDPPGCLCGEILQGIKKPPDCPLFNTRCTPEDPVGPCMVSSEGSCAAFYQYEVIK